MEPTNVNPLPDRDDAPRLEALLRRPAAALPDDGFSARVLSALPPPLIAPARARRSRRLWCAAGATLGAGVALLGAAPWNDAGETWTSLLSAFAPLSARFSDPTVLVTVVIALASVVYALRPARSRRFA